MTYTEKELEELAEFSNVKFSELDPSKAYIVKVEVDAMEQQAVHNYCCNVRECFGRLKIKNVIVVPVGKKYPDLKIFKLEQE